MRFAKTLSGGCICGFSPAGAAGIGELLLYVVAFLRLVWYRSGLTPSRKPTSQRDANKKSEDSNG